MKIKFTDRLLVLILFGVMAVMSTVQIISVDQGNKRSDLLRTAVIGQKEWSEVVAVCMLNVSGQVNFQQIPYTPEAVEQAVKDCFVLEGKKRGAPAADITTTTIVPVPTPSATEGG